MSLSVEKQSLMKRLEQKDTDTNAEIQRLTKELAQTRTYLQAKEEEVVIMRRERAEV